MRTVMKSCLGYISETVRCRKLGLGGVFVQCHGVTLI